MNFSDRLKQAMKKKGHTQGSLARAVGMAQSSVWRLTSGGAIGTKKLIKIAKVLDVNPEWLSDGIGKMEVNKSSDDAKLKIDSIFPYKNSSEIYNKYNFFELKLYKHIDSVVYNENEKNKDDSSMFLLPKEIIDETKSSIEDSIAVIVPDNSMSPAIQENSTIVLDTSVKDIKNGKTYLVSYGGIFMIRTLYGLPENKVKLKNNQPDDYPELTVSSSDLIIIGKLYYVAGKID